MRVKEMLAYTRTAIWKITVYNKAFRIIIAEARLPKQIQIERLLNSLDYYRILPVQNFDDLLALDHHAIEPFDMIIVNKGFLLSSEDNLSLFWRATRRVKNSLFYDDDDCADSIKSLMEISTRYARGSKR